MIKIECDGYGLLQVPICMFCMRQWYVFETNQSVRMCTYVYLYINRSINSIVSKFDLVFRWSEAWERSAYIPMNMRILFRFYFILFSDYIAVIIVVFFSSFFFIFFYCCYCDLLFFSSLLFNLFVYIYLI